MRRARNSFFFTAILLTLVTTACQRNTLYLDTVKMDDGKWSMYDPAVFSCSIDDTASIFNVSLSVRTSTDYPYRNLHLFIITTFPSGLTTADTVRAMLTDKKGKWIGRGAGYIRELEIPFKSNVYFPEPGEYHFRVIHGMRDTILNGVYDLGFMITLKD